MRSRTPTLRHFDNTTMLAIKHIPFLHVSPRPCRYELKRIADEAHKRKGDTTFARWEIEDFERKRLNRSRTSVVYVSRSSIEVRRTGDNGRVLGTSPAIQHSQEKLDTRFSGRRQFVFGQYYATDELFLVDDVIEWSHHERSWLEVRTVEDLMN